MGPTPTIIVLGNASLASSLLTGVSSLLVGLLVIGAAAILLAIVRLFHLFEVSRFSAVLLLILAAIPLTLALVEERTAIVGQARPEVVTAIVKRVDVGQDSATLSITTSRAVIVSVSLGPSKETLSRRQLEESPVPVKNEHTVIIRGLERATIYFYRVELDGKALNQVLTFTTLP